MGDYISEIAENKINLPKADKKELIRELIKQTKAAIFTGLLKNRFWQRKVITDGRGAEMMLGQQQIDLKKMTEWLEFLEEVEKEKD